MLKKIAGIFFNVLNILMGGNLPPLVSVCIVVEVDQRYLVVQRSSGKFVFPGGFVRWREQPEEAVQRESQEETGMKLIPGNVIGYQALTSSKFNLMSTLTIIYQGQVTGGTLQSSQEGQPAWLHESELRNQLSPVHMAIFDIYLRYRTHQDSTSTVQRGTADE